VTQVQCLLCQRISEQGNPRATSWDCACGGSYVLRRCSACRIVSQVTSLQRNGQPWDCTWCHAPNGGFASRNDPRAATIGDLGADMAKHGLAFTPKASADPADTAPRDLQPVFIVTMNEVPGHRITQVHGDVFGLVVRARNYFSNLGASLTTLTGGEVTGYTKLLIDSRNQARQRMWHEARARGANAVVAMRFDCNEIGDVMSEVVAYGTAVTVEPLQQATTTGQS
jgi:uncharacterized protein YbjQ (UPF0145 family)